MKENRHYAPSPFSIILTIPEIIEKGNIISIFGRNIQQ
jgi:hypothetical protein